MKDSAVEPASTVRWVRLDGSGFESAVPHGWFGRDTRLSEYIRAARTGLPAELASLSFHWVERGSAWVRVDLVVGVATGQSRPYAEASATPVGAPYGLTVRELEVLTLVAGGLTNPEIAERTGVARRTVATHVEHVLGKLGVPTRTAAAGLALSAQLVLLPLPGGPEGLAPIGVQQLESAVLERGAARPRRRKPRPLVRKHPVHIGGIYPLSGPRRRGRRRPPPGDGDGREGDQ